MKFINSIYNIILATIFVSCEADCTIDGISNSEFVRGVILEDCHINYLINDLYNFKTDKLENPIKEKQNNYYLFATSSPYLCGGCARVGLGLVNHFSSIYPGQVKLVVTDYYRKDTNRSISEIEYDANLDVYLDINGECIKFLYNKSNLLTEAWYLIIDQYGNIVYAVAKPYDFEYEIPESEAETIIDQFHKYLIR